MEMNRVKELLRVNEFEENITNIEEITLYAKKAGDTAYIIVLCDFTGIRKPDSAQLHHILWRIRTDGRFSMWRQQTLVLLLARDMGYGRRLIQDGVPAWIIDEVQESLMVYEEQPEDFAGLRGQLERLLERESREPERNNLSYTYTPCNTALAVLNVLVFAAMNLLAGGTGSREMVKWGAIYTPIMSEPKELYRIFTAMFLHFDVGHLTSNMIILVSLGGNLERALGSWRYVLMYLLSGIGAGALSYIYNISLGNTVVAAGASGAIFGVIGGLFFLTVKNRGKFRQMTAPRLALMIVYVLYSGFTTPGIDNAAHIGGVLSGLIITAVMSGRQKECKV